jgi:adenylate kinase
MLNIVLFGPPGAGKGTQSENLIKHFQLSHLSTGDIFRANIKGGTELGKLAQSYMDKGELVPDEVTIKMLESEYDKVPHAKGFIFDGFPRTEAQAAALDKFLAGKGTAITKMLALEVDDTELMRRLLERGKSSGRSDDQNPTIIANRINEYNTKTAPLKSYYSQQGKFVSINGIGSVEEIFERLKKSLS